MDRLTQEPLRMVPSGPAPGVRAPWLAANST